MRLSTEIVKVADVANPFTGGLIDKHCKRTVPLQEHVTKSTTDVKLVARQYDTIRYDTIRYDTIR